MWYLLLLAMVAVVGFAVWDFRRKSAAREAASKQRFEEMFMARPAPVPRPDSPSAAAMPGIPQEAAPIVAASAAAAPPALGRFLGPRETLLYRLLKAGVPDHEVFANATLASVMGGRNEQELRRFAQYRLDFVVCDKAMCIVAVVEMAAGASQAVGDARFKADSLKAAGIRLVRFDAARLPRREEIRALITGRSAAEGPVATEQPPFQ